MPGTYRYHWKSIDVSSWMAQTKTSKLLEWKSFLVKNWKIANRLATFDWFAPKHSLSSRNDDNPNYRTDELGSSLECVRAQCFRCSMLFSIENEQWTMKTANRMLFLMDTLPILCRWNYPHLENANNIVICSVNNFYSLTFTPLPNTTFRCNAPSRSTHINGPCKQSQIQNGNDHFHDSLNYSQSV